MEIAEYIVLVVDDEPYLRSVIEISLISEGIKVMTAATVEEALQILDCHKIALTVLDWGLRGAGDTSGRLVLDHCRKHHVAMPVIVMSGMPHDVRTDAILNEAAEFLNKPFSASIMVTSVKKWLKWVEKADQNFWPQHADESLTLEEAKNLYIRRVVKLFDGNVSKAAEKLEVSRNTVSNALKHTEILNQGGS